MQVYIIWFWLVPDVAEASKALWIFMATEAARGGGVAVGPASATVIVVRVPEPGMVHHDLVAIQLNEDICTHRLHSVETMGKTMGEAIEKLWKHGSMGSI